MTLGSGSATQNLFGEARNVLQKDVSKLITHKQATKNVEKTKLDVANALITTLTIRILPLTLIWTSLEKMALKSLLARHL